MNRIEAEKLQRKAYCELCPTKLPVIALAPLSGSMAHDGWTQASQPTVRDYIVVCPTELHQTTDHGPTSLAHPLSVAPSQFAKYLERWRQGERLFSLEGEIFAKALRKMQRGDPIKWDYEETPEQGVIRIGHEWWPGLTTEETEKMSQAVQVYSHGQLDIIRRQIAPDATDEQFEYFMAVAIRSGLDPIRKQVYAIFYNKRELVNGKWQNAKEKRMSIQTGIDGYRAIAARSKVYAGSDDPEYGPIDGNGYPEWATVTVYKIVASVRCPFKATCRWDEFAYETRDGQRVVKGEYADRPRNQLAIRAESHALRKGFPEEMADIEIAERPGRVTIIEDIEVDQITGELIEVTAHEVPPAEETAQEAPADTTTLFSDIIFENIEDDPEYQKIADILTEYGTADNIEDMNTIGGMLKGVTETLTDRQKVWIAEAYTAAQNRLKQPQRR